MTDTSIAESIRILEERASQKDELESMISTLEQKLSSSGRGEEISQAEPSSRTRIMPNIINEINRGMMMLLPEVAKRPLESIGVGVETDFSNTPMGAGTRYTGAAIPAALAPVAMSRQGGQLISTPQNTGMMQRFVNEIGDFALKNPGTYLGGEAACGS